MRHSVNVGVNLVLVFDRSGECLIAGYLKLGATQVVDGCLHLDSSVTISARLVALPDITVVDLYL